MIASLSPPPSFLLSFLGSIGLYETVSIICTYVFCLMIQTPDMEDSGLVKRAVEAVQGLVEDSNIIAGHDVSDGGPLITVLEMAFAGNVGIQVNFDEVRKQKDEVIESSHPLVEMMLPSLFAEELGLVIEVANDKANIVRHAFENKNVPIRLLGSTRLDQHIEVSAGGIKVLEGSLSDLRDTWESTAFQLDALQVIG